MFNKSLSKQFLVWVTILSIFILSCSIIIFFVQNHVFLSYTKSKDHIEEKYSYVEIIDNTVNKAIFDFSRLATSKDTSYFHSQQKYEQTIEAALEDLNQVSTTTKDQTYLKGIEEFLNYYFNDILALTASYVESNQTDEITALINKPRFNSEIIEQRNQSLSYKTHLNNITTKTNTTYDSSRQLIEIIVFLYILLSLLTVFIIVRIILRRIGAPLQELAYAANQLSAGQRDVSIQELKRHDELGVLSKAFNRMIGKINQAEIAEQQLNKELTIKNKELEQIVYIASHDLRSPLINIQGFNKELQASFYEIQSLLQSERNFDDIKEQVAYLMSEDIPEAFDFIIASTNKMDLLLNALLRLSRIGREKPNIQPLDMNQLISKVGKNFEYQMSENNVTLEIGEVPQAFADQSLIDQVVSNLIGNALKFAHPERDGLIKVYGYVENERSVYCVEDNGVGISQQYQKQIFDLFEKIDPDIEGEGLGLTIIRKILERHGGDIWIESEVDLFSKFYFSIPRPR